MAVAKRLRTTPTALMTALGSIGAKVKGLLVHHRGRLFMVDIGRKRRVRGGNTKAVFWKNAQQVPGASVELLFQALAVPESRQREALAALRGATGTPPKRRTTAKGRTGRARAEAPQAAAT